MQHHTKGATTNLISFEMTPFHFSLEVYRSSQIWHRETGSRTEFFFFLTNTSMCTVQLHPVSGSCDCHWLNCPRFTYQAILIKKIKILKCLHKYVHYNARCCFLTLTWRLYYKTISRIYWIKFCGCQIVPYVQKPADTELLYISTLAIILPSPTSHYRRIH